MNAKRTLIYSALGIVCLFQLAGCSTRKDAQPVNELHFDITAITDVTISYDEEDITFYPSESQELVIKEYMTDSSPRYRAHVKQVNNTIRVSEGGKPFFKGGFSRTVEVYLPKEYGQNLTVTTTDGDVSLSGMNLELVSLRIDSSTGTVQLDEVDAPSIHLSSTSGTLRLGTISGGQIRIETTSGTVVCDKLSGNVTYTSTSGDLDVKFAAGCGTYRADNSGTLKVNYTQVTGPLSLYNKNDLVDLVLPQGLEFEFEAITKNGSVTATFGESLSTDGRTASGTIGEHPAVSIKVETKNGNIQVAQ